MGMVATRRTFVAAGLGLAFGAVLALSVVRAEGTAKEVTIDNFTLSLLPGTLCQQCVCACVGAPSVRAWYTQYGRLRLMRRPPRHSRACRLRYPWRRFSPADIANQTSQLPLWHFDVTMPIREGVAIPLGSTQSGRAHTPDLRYVLNFTLLQAW